MNILLVSQPSRDGVLRHVSGLADFLIAEGDCVHLAYSGRNAGDQLCALVHRVRTAGGGVLNLGVRNAPQPRDLSALIQLLSFIRRIRPDVIHAHSSKAGALVRCLALLGLRSPMFYSPHAYYRMHNPSDWNAGIFHFVERFLGRIGTTIVLSECESEFAEQVVGVPRDRMVVSRNAVNFDAFSPGTVADQLAVRAQLGLPQTARLLGSVGRFSHQKDPLTMYAAFAEIAHELPDVHLVHLGQGELEQEVDAFVASRGIASRCHRVPYLSKTAPFYRALDGFLLSSLYEGMSYAVLEALATNLPLILTRAPGNNAFASYGFSHIDWCEPGNAVTVAAAIRCWRRMLDSPDIPNHRAISHRHFGVRACFQPIREAYRLQARYETIGDPQQSEDWKGLKSIAN